MGYVRGNDHLGMKFERQVIMSSSGTSGTQTANFTDEAIDTSTESNLSDL